VAVRKPRVSKADLFLADLSTTPTFQPLNVKIKKHSLRSDGNHPKSPGNSSSKNNLSTPAKRATKLSPFTLDGKNDRTSHVSGANILIANQTKTVIQKACGHASPPIIGNPRQISSWGCMSIFFNYKKYASTG
jgi:hypothetical protein